MKRKRKNSTYKHINRYTVTHCSYCNQTGQVDQKVGKYVIETITCPKCEGEGHIVTDHKSEVAWSLVLYLLWYTPGYIVALVALVIGSFSIRQVIFNWITLTLLFAVYEFFYSKKIQKTIRELKILDKNGNEELEKEILALYPTTPGSVRLKQLLESKKTDNRLEDDSALITSDGELTEIAVKQLNVSGK